MLNGLTPESRRLGGVLTLLLSIVVAGNRGQLAAGEPPSLDELRSAVDSQSLNSISVAYTQTRPSPQGPQTSRHVWARQGSSELFRTEYTDETIGSWMSFDGILGYHLGYSRDRKPQMLELKDTAPDVYKACRFTSLLGLHIAQGAGSISDALHSPHVEIKESADPTSLIVEIREFASKPNPTEFNLTVEFDSGKPGLVRRFMYFAPATPTWKFSYIVDKFEQFRDASTGKQRWFPVEGRYLQETPERGIETFQFVATEIKINERLPEAVFVPETPEGVHIVDNTTQPAKVASILTLDELRVAVADHASSLRSLYVDHTETLPPTQGGKTRHHVWARQDSKVLFRTEYTDDTVGHWMSFDGTRAYHLGFSNDRHPQRLELRDPPPETYKACRFPNLLGLNIAQGGSSISEALASETAQLQTPRADGIYTVTVKNFSSKPNATPFDVTIAIDARHDYLLRRIDYVAPSHPVWKFAYEVKKFAMIDDVASGRQRWFPMEGRHIQETPEHGIEEFPYSVSEVRCNASLPDSVFIPELPDGLSVVDNTENGHGRYYIVGGFNSTDAHLDGLAEDAIKALAGRNWTRLILVNLGFAALVCTAVLLKYIRKRSSGL